MLEISVLKLFQPLVPEPRLPVELGWICILPGLTASPWEVMKSSDSRRDNLRSGKPLLRESRTTNCFKA